MIPPAAPAPAPAPPVGIGTGLGTITAANVSEEAVVNAIAAAAAAHTYFRMITPQWFSTDLPYLIEAASYMRANYSLTLAGLLTNLSG